jgi:hypothetical protein
MTSCNFWVVWLFNIRWGHQCDWPTLCQGGSFRELLVVTGINDFHGYLLVFLDQGPGYVESFGQMGLQTQSCEAIFHSEGALQSTHHHFLSLYKHRLINGHYQAGRWRPHSNTSSSVKHSIWHSRSSDASYACRTSSPKMNSFVIMGTNTQIFSGWLPHDYCLETFLQDGGGLPQTPSAACSVGLAVFHVRSGDCH